MANSRSCILGVLWLLCFVNGLHVDRVQLSTRQMIDMRSSVKLFLNADDRDNEMQNDDLTVESSTKVLSKYETRSKLLEAALMTSRSRESKVDAENVRLTNEIAKINQRIGVSEKNSLQNILLLETTKANLYESLKESSADVARLEKELEISRNENIAEVTKYRNRLTLLENAYRESQVLVVLQDLVIPKQLDDHRDCHSSCTDCSQCAKVLL
jgi:hypothetical protein